MTTDVERLRAAVRYALQQMDQRPFDALAMAYGLTGREDIFEQVARPVPVDLHLVAAGSQLLPCNCCGSLN